MSKSFDIIGVPIRIIPYDTGADLSGIPNDDIIKAIDPEIYIIKLSNHQRKLMPKCKVAGMMTNQIRFGIFENGMCVFAIEDENLVFEDREYFSAEYCLDRKKKHQEFRVGTHATSDILNNFVEKLREFVRSRSSTKIRATASPDFENGGMSYVMTMVFLKTKDHDALEVEQHVSLKRNILAILNPTTILLEDYDDSNPTTYTEIKNNIKDLDAEDRLKDYEQRRHISTFMSWSSVIILGDPEDADYEDYIMMESSLQSNWHEVYCLECCMPKTIAEAEKKKLSMMDLQRAGNEAEMFIDEVGSVRFSELPSRYVDVQEGLLESSGLIQIAQRYEKKMKNVSEMMKTKNQERQRRFSLSSELLLFFIAMVQLFPIVHSLMEDTDEWIPYTLILIILIIGAIVLFMKNRM